MVCDNLKGWYYRFGGATDLLEFFGSELVCFGALALPALCCVRTLICVAVSKLHIALVAFSPSSRIPCGCVQSL